MSYRLIISGGGTGGHIFPALAIADEFKSRYADAELLFVGAADRMEMQQIPEHGYPIVGLWISGIQRKSIWRNVLLPFKWVHSVMTSFRIIRQFKPDVVVGVGGYASAAVLYAAGLKGIPTLIQEQNSYAGVTNAFLGKKARRICVAFEGMDRFFSPDKLVLTGNPVRKALLNTGGDTPTAKRSFGLSPDKPVVMITGGSLGARTINEAIAQVLPYILQSGWQVLWQTGRVAYETYKIHEQEGCVVLPFLKDMRMAYDSCDMVICRAGALTLSEICVLGKPSVLIPSPFVAEDHQTHNAGQLVRIGAACMLTDNQELPSSLHHLLQELLWNDAQRIALGQQALTLSKPNATALIVDQIVSLLAVKTG
jgi:UDP-N-acetylglucosamine--N-acetylmuramyl-(pentapeptide) pyrophosphoryl-undecaprenol N-acetylglucosamine transferase